MRIGVDSNSVYNLKRRMTSLPPISHTIFHEQILHLSSESEEDEPSASSHPQSGQSQKNISIPVDEDNFNPLQCLFCNHESTSLDANLGHMSRAHSFFIPDAEFLIDLESFLGYLFTIVSGLHECLFCGSLRSTKSGVQDHMRGKGHCRLNFEDDEDELMGFYDFSMGEEEGEEVEGEATLVADEDGLRLPSGKTLGHRSHARQFRQRHPDRASSVSPPRQLALNDGSDGETETTPAESRDRRLATRSGTSTSLIGVPELKQRAMIAAEKKMEKLEATARNEYQSKVDKGGNKQKRYKVSSMGKKAGGLEKRLG